ncbi:hypothetical protein EUTSA_v10015709mg [Eutrema salsugineum]|uniref:F-box domain-containing protein n=1 Tax=Eutrema salsugineum TaxID=72664 RepID=V4LSC1_EUTSA|nr:F-box/FBD/LRR-repeat protein At4g26340 [Eutrema salsugineum]ESQ42778.1 hypothetical protein EUTSA_v10015709mg [Eutrema salsugineum]
MSNINELPDDLLVKILSTLPTKDAVTTCLLSKRWESLWKNVARLEYDQEYHYARRIGFSRFVDKSLLSHQYPVLQSLHFKFKTGYAYGEIGLWIRTAISRHIRELTLECGDFLIQLPFSLFTCETLVILKLKGWIDQNIPLTTSLPSLKTLHIVLLRESNYETFSRLLSNCPVLVDLMLEQRKSNALSKLNIAVPSLQRLLIRTVTESDNNDLRYSSYQKYIPKVAINVPSLKYLNIDNNRGNDFDVVSNLPHVVEASIKSNAISTKAFLRHLTSSVKRLSLYSLKPEDMDPSIFCQLVHLELCTSASGWLKLLARMLQCSLKLRVLKLFNNHSSRWMRPLDRWDQPSSVPKCMRSSLETLEWRGYFGRETDKDIMSYLLKHSMCLRTVKITPNESKCLEKMHQMVEDLASVLSIGSSNTCKLVFNI